MGSVTKPMRLQQVNKPHANTLFTVHRHKHLAGSSATLAHLCDCCTQAGKPLSRLHLQRRRQISATAVLPQGFIAHLQYQPVHQLQA